jgi:hypothetical protein
MSAGCRNPGSILGSWKRMCAKLLLTLVMVGCLPKACTGGPNDISPEDQLHSYIKAAVNITKPEHRNDLVGLTTGGLKAALVNASEETFKRAYIDKKYDFRGFEVMSSKQSDDGKETTIDFKLTYRSWNAGEPEDRAPVTQTTNRATLQYEHGQWALSKVESLSSQFDWEVGLPMDDVKTDGVKPEDAPVEVQSSRDQVQEEQKEQEQTQKELEKAGE